MEIRRIFHPTDFSRGADAALRYAIDMALRFEAHLLVGHVVYGGRAYWDGQVVQDDGDVYATLREHVEGALSQINDGPERLDASYHVIRHISPAAGIIHFVDVKRIDLIVLGTHGRRGIRRLLLGSVALNVLHAAQADVVLVPYRADVLREGRVVVPVDFHDRSEALVARAGQVAAASDAPVDLVHVLDIRPEDRLKTDRSLSPEMAPLSDVARERLDLLAEATDPIGPVATHVETGRPEASILRHLTERNACLVVIGSSGMTPEERLRLHPADRDLGEEMRWAVGPVAEHVATRSPVPVWIVKKFSEEETSEVNPAHVSELAAQVMQLEAER